jgi:hypothetical protein
VQQVGPKVFVSFEFMRKDGTKGFDRIFLTGARDLVTQTDVEAIERGVVEQSGGQLARITILNWKPLQG